MIRNKTEEKKRRLSTKTLDQSFRKETEEGLNCSPIESKALIDIVREIYMPYLHNNQLGKAGLPSLSMFPPMWSG